MERTLLQIKKSNLTKDSCFLDRFVRGPFFFSLPAELVFTFKLPVGFAPESEGIGPALLGMSPTILGELIQPSFTFLEGRLTPFFTGDVFLRLGCKHTFF